MNYTTNELQKLTGLTWDGTRKRLRMQGIRPESPTQWRDHGVELTQEQVDELLKPRLAGRPGQNGAMKSDFLREKELRADASARWLLMKEIAAELGVTRALVRSALEAMPEVRRSDTVYRVYYSCPPEVMSRIAAKVRERGADIAVADEKKTPRGVYGGYVAECPESEWDSRKDHSADYRRKLAVLKARQAEGRRVTIDGFSGFPVVGKGRHPLTVELLTPGGRSRIFLIASIADKEVL